MPNLNSLVFDLTNCTLREHSPAHRGWTNPAGVAHMLQFRPAPPTHWPFDLTDPDAAAFFYHHQSADNGGVLLSMDVAPVAGHEALRGLFKYRAPVPADSLGMCYVGILWLPFADCTYQINVEAMERGTTGAREAAVMVLLGDAWPTPPQPATPTVVHSQAELVALLRSTPVRELPSDDERYDATFPDHPLSLVRARLAQVAASAKFNATGRDLRPFRRHT